MFMRYRGGGIGHKYMRKIEEIFENMSRERMHHKDRKRGSLAKGTTDTNAVDSSDDEREPGGSERTRAAGATEGGGEADEDDEGSDSDSDYEPDETDSERSDSSEDSDSDDSDSEGELLETYGLGAL